MDLLSAMYGFQVRNSSPVQELTVNERKETNHAWMGSDFSGDRAHCGSAWIRPRRRSCDRDRQDHLLRGDCPVPDFRCCWTGTGTRTNRPLVNSRSKVSRESALHAPRGGRFTISGFSKAKAPGLL